MNSTRILLADDHGIVRKGLRLQLEQNSAFAVVGEATDGRAAV
jgi:DNA-binding NarL/FixJ family response regulator